MRHEMIMDELRRYVRPIKCDIELIHGGSCNARVTDFNQEFVTVEYYGGTKQYVLWESIAYIMVTEDAERRQEVDE